LIVKNVAVRLASTEARHPSSLICSIASHKLVPHSRQNIDWSELLFHLLAHGLISVNEVIRRHVSTSIRLFDFACTAVIAVTSRP
jgi:hypothetical protein